MGGLGVFLEIGHEDSVGGDSGTSLPLRDRTSPSHGLRKDDKGRDSPSLPHAIAIPSNNGSL